MDSGKQRVEELRGPVVDTDAVTRRLPENPLTPLFMKDKPDSNKGTAQDVKDDTEE